MLLIVLLWMLMQPRAWASKGESLEVSKVRQYFLGISAHRTLGLPEDKSKAVMGLGYLFYGEKDVEDYLKFLQKEHGSSSVYASNDIVVLSALMILQTDEAVKRINHIWSELFSQDFSVNVIQKLRVNYPEDIYDWDEEHFESFKELAQDHLCASDGKMESHFCLYAIKLLRFITSDKDNNFSQDIIRQNSRLAPNVAQFFRTPYLGLLAAPYMGALFNEGAAGLPKDSRTLREGKLSMTGIWQQWLSNNNAGTYDDVSIHVIPSTDTQGLSKETMNSLRVTLKRPHSDNASADGLVGLVLQRVGELEDYIESIRETMGEIVHRPGESIEEQINIITQFLNHDTNLTLTLLIERLGWRDVVVPDIHTVATAIKNRIEEAEKGNTELVEKLQDRNSILENENNLLQSECMRLQVEEENATSKLKSVTRKYEDCSLKSQRLTRQNNEMLEDHKKALKVLGDECEVKLSRAGEREKELVNIASEAVDSLVEAPASSIEGERGVSLGLLENKYRSGTKELLVSYLSALTQNASRLMRHQCDKERERKTSALLFQKAELKKHQKECLSSLQSCKEEHELISTMLRDARPNLGSEDLKEGIALLIRQYNAELHERQDLERQYEDLSHQYQAMKENVELSKTSPEAEKRGTSLLDELREVGSDFNYGLGYNDFHGTHTPVEESSVSLEMEERLHKCLEEVQRIKSLRKELKKVNMDCASRLHEVEIEVTNTYHCILERALKLVEHERFQSESLKSTLRSTGQNKFVNLLDDLMGKVTESTLRSQRAELQEELNRQRRDLVAEQSTRLIAYGNFRKLGKPHRISLVVVPPRLGKLVRDASLFADVLGIFDKNNNEGSTLINDMRHLRERINDKKPLLEVIDQLQEESILKAKLDKQLIRLQEQRQALIRSCFKCHLPISSFRETVAPRALSLPSEDSPPSHSEHPPPRLGARQEPSEEVKVLPPSSEPVLGDKESAKELALLQELFKLRRAYAAALSLLWFHLPRFRPVSTPLVGPLKVVKIPVVKWKNRFPLVANRAWQLRMMSVGIEYQRLLQISHSHKRSGEEANNTFQTKTMVQPPSRNRLPFDFLHIRRLCLASTRNSPHPIRFLRDSITKTGRVSATTSPRLLQRTPLTRPKASPPLAETITLQKSVSQFSSKRSSWNPSPQLVTKIGDKVESRVDKRYLPPPPAHLSSPRYGAVAKAATHSRDSPCVGTIKAWQEMNGLVEEDDNKPVITLDDACLLHLSAYDISAATNLQLAHIEARRWPAHLLHAISPAMIAYIRFDYWQPDQAMCSAISIGQLSILKEHPVPYSTFKFVCHR